MYFNVLVNIVKINPEIFSTKNVFIFSRLVFWLTHSCQLENVANALLSRCSFTIWPGRSVVVWNAEEQVIIVCYLLYLFILSFHRTLTGFVCDRGNGCKWRWELGWTLLCVLAGLWCKFLSSDVIGSGFGKTNFCWRQCTAAVLLHSYRCHILPNLLFCNVRTWSKSCVGFEGIWYVKLLCILTAA